MHSDSYQVEIRTTANGNIDVRYYTEQAQVMRSEYLSELGKSLISWVKNWFKTERFVSLDALYGR